MKPPYPELMDWRSRVAFWSLALFAVLFLLFLALALREG